MTGYESKRAAAQDKLKDDDTQIYQDHPAQEPVAWKETDEVECPVCRDKGFPWPKCGHITYLERTTPPQRPWVDLTDEEVVNLGYSADGNVCTAVRLAATYIKEKNT